MRPWRDEELSYETATPPKSRPSPKADPRSLFQEVAREIAGSRSDVDLSKILQSKLNELMEENAQSGDPFPHLVCPSCSSQNLKRSSATDYQRDETYYL